MDELRAVPQSLGAGLRCERDQAVAAALGSAPPADQHGPTAAAAQDADELSARELEVARLVADGLSNPAIASALFISVATVKTHVSHILTKLGLDSRVQLANWVASHNPSPPVTARDVGNIPLPASSFIGRGSELEQTAAVLGESRVVTLTGAGGVGKTRLALQAPGGSPTVRGLLSWPRSAPPRGSLAARFEYRTCPTAKDAPEVLGPSPSPPPDPSGLPPGAARVMRAAGVAMGEMFGRSEAPHEEKLLRGLAASGGVYEGPGRRVSGPSDFDRIIEGDVLVTESTSEAFNILLPLLGAIVTDSGGLLSHSAIVAREYGIPGVVGTREATERIPDGTLVRVDGNIGEVTVYA